MISAKSKVWFRLYQHYKKGVLLLGGGLVDQPANYLEAMEILESKLLEVTPSGNS